LFDVQNKLNKQHKWFPVAEKKRGTHKESFEIIRILADELPEKPLYLYDAQDRGKFKTYLMKMKKQEEKSAKTKNKFSSAKQFLRDMQSEFNDGWDWDFPEAVFQSGVSLPEFNRMYLLRCLYRRSVSEKKFLGWKVQLLRDLSSSEDLEHPFWELSKDEEQALASELRKYGLFSTIDFQQANTPQIERKRRIVFQTEVENLLN